MSLPTSRACGTDRQTLHPPNARSECSWPVLRCVSFASSSVPSLGRTLVSSGGNIPRQVNPTLGSDTTDWGKSIERHMRMELLLKSKPRQDCFPVGYRTRHRQGIFRGGFRQVLRPSPQGGGFGARWRILRLRKIPRPVCGYSHRGYHRS